MPEGRGKTPDDGAGDLAPGLMTEYLTDAWGFFIRSARQYEKKATAPAMTRIGPRPAKTTERCSSLSSSR